MPDKSRLPKFDPQVYTRLRLTDLVVFSIHYLEQQGGEIASEDIISACFLLFPKRFALRKYPHWPDSAMVIRRWSECRARGYLRAARGFSLTVKGTKFAERVGRKLGLVAQPTQVEKARPIKRKQAEASKKTRPVKAKKVQPAPVTKVKARVPARTQQMALPFQEPPPAPPVDKLKAGKFVRMMEASDAYTVYKKHGSRSQISEFDFRSLLLCTMESSPETLARNVDLFKGYAGALQKQNLTSFLEFCEDSFSSLLKPSVKSSKR